MPASFMSVFIKIPLCSDSCFPFSLPWRWKEMIILSLKATCWRWKSHCMLVCECGKASPIPQLSQERLPCAVTGKREKKKMLLCLSHYYGIYLLQEFTFPWCWERLRAGGEGDDGGWDGLMASPTQSTWVWVTSGSWWWTGGLTCCGSWGRRVGHNCATEVNWIYSSFFLVSDIFCELAFCSFSAQKSSSGFLLPRV